MAGVRVGLLGNVPSLPSDQALSHEHRCSDCFLHQQWVELTSLLDISLWSLSASRTIHHQVTSTQSGRAMPLSQAASTAVGADPAHGTSRALGQIPKLWFFSLTARSLYRTCWRLTTNYNIFNQSLDQQFIDCWSCTLGPEMDTVLGTKGTKMRDKVKEHGAQEKGRQVQDNSQGSLGTHMRGHPERQMKWRRSTGWASSALNRKRQLGPTSVEGGVMSMR